MNGRIDKVHMESRLCKILTGLENRTWYPEWDDRQRGAATRIMVNALEILDEYAS